MKKLKDGIKTTWIESRAETTYNTFKQSLEEFIQSQPTDDQGKTIQPSQENYMDLWIKAAGGVHKGRVYDIGSEFSFSCQSFGSGGSSSSRSPINQNEFELLNRRIVEITELYAQKRAAREEEAKRREEEDRRKEEEMRRKDIAFTRVTGDVESLKAQLNYLLASGAFHVPRSPSHFNNTKE
uniref:Uncharacterized protein LOC104241413 n=1 Tax=Nicotiana sylvestris TaxID=4096 RepID=A0A1U7XUN6_NICSY|nr:PREDICTED: uncharacterized protein LOC104241413 [Nicotiana sylvestris]XP_009794652.1 PREDICTED: uncharacterized protein LOC104241413 [Nicotiana sylvestris]XP_009794653.1 PREDICTED: uncharacterized protein LOC104241413 [Nicotiana sylvestris]